MNIRPRWYLLRPAKGSSAPIQKEGTGPLRRTNGEEHGPNPKGVAGPWRDDGVMVDVMVEMKEELVEVKALMKWKKKRKWSGMEKERYL